MTYKEKIELLKERRLKLKRRIAKEQKDYKKLLYKSRNVRMSSHIGPRIGFFKDLVLELNNAIGLLEGKISKKQYLNYQDGDDMDKILMSL